MDRLGLLKQFVEQEPGDPFNHYALALECLKVDPAEAARIFEKLTVTHPGYLPTYYPYAHLLIEQKETENAEKVFNRGIETAKAASDAKTLRELQSAYQDWKFNL